MLNHSLKNALLLGSLAMASLTPALAENIYAYKKGDNNQLFLTNIKQDTSGAEKFTEISVTYYPDTKLHKGGAIPDTYNPITAAKPSHSSNRNAYDHLIRVAAARYGVDPALIKAIIHTESAFNPNARSPVGAMGLMQLMPGTARDMGVANAWDPAQNIEGGVKYLAWLQRQFSNRDYVIAAYNAGLGNVRKYGGIPPFRETQNYVRSVNNRYATLYRADAGLMGGYVAQAPVVAPAPVTHTAPSVQSVSYATPQNPTIQGGSGRIYISSGSSTLQR